MDLQQQICSLEQSRKLKQLGMSQTFHQRSFCFEDCEYGRPLLVLFEREDSVTVWHPYATFNNATDLKMKKYLVQAFTVAELGVMLPEMFASRYGAGICVCYNDSGFTEEYHEENHKAGVGNNEAQCRADMLIYLLKNNLLTPEDCNRRLSAK